MSETRGDLGFFRFDAEHRLVTGGSAMWPGRGAEQKVRDVAGQIQRVGHIADSAQQADSTALSELQPYVLQQLTIRQRDQCAI